MKTRNEFKSYVVIWCLSIIIFNILAFVFKQEVIGQRITEQAKVFEDGSYGTKNVFTDQFLNLLISYIFVLIAFIGQLICTKIFLSQASLKDTMYHYPFFSISLTGLIITIIYAVVFCIINLHPITSFVIFLLTLAFTIFRCTAAKTAANMVIAKDENLKVKTEYIKLLKAESAALVSKAKGTKEKKLISKVADAIRFSDPISIPELSDIEKNMIEKFSAIGNAINENFDELEKECESFLDLLNERNVKVKSLKLK